MSDHQFSTPIVLIIFNRPDTTASVFEEIAKIKPSKLLVIADGARANKKGELDLVTKTRAIISRVNWPCQVRTNYSESNLGCKLRVASGLDWVFSLESEAIILEDDCLPDNSFFFFCQEMLERYRENKMIGMISGDNFQKGIMRGDGDYYLSKYAYIWGWATWSDRWIGCYDVSMKDWPAYSRSQDFYGVLGGSQKLIKYWNDIFESVYRGLVDTWDYQWLYANWRYKRINIIPNINLISNIGFGANATHTKIENELSMLPALRMNFPLKHPSKIELNLAADQFTENFFMDSNIFNRIFKRLLRKFK